MARIGPTMICIGQGFRARPRDGFRISAIPLDQRLLRRVLLHSWTVHANCRPSPSGNFMRSILCVCLLLVLPGLATSPPARAREQQSVGQQREDVLFWTQAQRTARFSRMYEIFPADRVAHDTHVHALPQGTTLVPRWDDGTTTLASYMTQQHLAGVLVLQRGRIRLRRYAPGFGPEQRWTSFSVAKSVTSTLLGIALRQGDIHSLDDTLKTYIPQLRDSAYGGQHEEDIRRGTHPQ